MVWTGIPYRDGGRDAGSGLDCWGLVRAWYKRELGIELPSYAGRYASAEERREVAALINGEISRWDRVEAPQRGDVIRLWIRDREHPSHVAIALGDGLMLHTRRRIGACIEDTRDPQWSQRIVDFWRYTPRAAAAGAEGGVAPELVPIPGETWQLVACPSPVSNDAVTLHLGRRTTILEGLVRAGVRRDRNGGEIRVLVGDEEVPREWWGRIYPHPGQLVIARSVPRDPVSLFFLIGGLAADALIGVSAGVAAGLAITAGVVGTLAVYAGIAYTLSAVAAAPEPKKPNAPRGPAESPAANGVGNQLVRWGKVRSGYGEMRTWPDLMAPAYTVITGAEKHWRIGLVVGRGRYQVDQRTFDANGKPSGRCGIEVGGVPIEDIPGARWEILEGGKADGYDATVLDTEPEDDGPEHYWSLQDAAGAASAADSAPGGAPLVAGGGVTFGVAGLLPATPGTCAYFDGVNDYLELAAPPIASLAGSWTLEAWMKADGLPAAGTHRTLACCGDTTSGIEIAMASTGNATIVIPGVGTFGEFAPISPLWEWSGGTTVTNGLHHVVIVRRGDDLEIWGDGIRWYSLGDLGVTAPPSAPARFTLGARWNGAARERFWKGWIERVALYPVALTEDEISLHFQLGRTGTGELNLLLDSPQEISVNAAFELPALQDGVWYVSPWHSREPAGEVDELSVDGFFPQGIYRVSDSGRTRPSSVGIDIEYRRSGTEEWFQAAAHPDLARQLQGPLYKLVPSRGWGGGGEPAGNATPDGLPAILVAGRVEEQILFGLRWGVPRGRWEVRYRTFATEETNNRNGSSGTAAAIGGHQLLTIRGTKKKSAPVRAKGLCLVGLSLPVREVGSTVGEISVYRKRMLPIYAPGDAQANAHGFTPPRTTNNSADAYIDMLIGEESANALPIGTQATAAQKLHLGEIADFRTRAKPWHGEFDFGTNAFDAAKMILAVSHADIGRASGGRYSVVEDRAGLPSRQLVTPRNGRAWHGVKRWIDPPHAARVAFQDAAQEFQTVEALVFADGYSQFGELAGTAAATVYDQLDARGITDRTEAIAFGKKWLRILWLRDEQWTVEMFLDHLVARRGQVVDASIPMALVGQRASRVVSVTTDGGGNVTALVLEDRVTYAPTKLYGCRYRLQNGDHFETHAADVTNPAGGTAVESATITFAAPIPAATAPSVGRLFAFGERGAEVIPCLIRAIRKRGLMAELTLIPYYPQVHNAVNEPASYTPIVSSPEALPTRERPAPPKIVDVASDERFLAVTKRGLEAHLRVLVREGEGGRAPTQAVQIRWRMVADGADPSFAFDGRWHYSEWSERFPTEFLVGPVEDGAVYRIEARATAQGGRASLFGVPHEHRVIGKLAPPPDVTDVRRDGDGDELVWTYPATVLDLDGFRIRYLHGQQPAGLWNAARPAHRAIWRGTRFPLANLPRDAQPLTLLVKAVDLAGVESVQAARVVVPASFATRNVVIDLDHRALGWPGTKTDCAVSGGDLVADVEPDADAQPAWLDDDSLPAWDADDSVDAWAPHGLRATYVAAWTPALAELDDEVRLNFGFFPPQALVALEYRELGPAAAWADDDSADAWDADDGVPAWGAEEWSEWRPWLGRIAQTERKPYELRITLSPLMRSRARLFLLNLITDADDLRETLRNVPISAAGSRLPVTLPFREIKHASAVSTTGKMVAVKDREIFGPFVEAREGGVLVADSVDAEVVGY